MLIDQNVPMSITTKAVQEHLGSNFGVRADGTLPDMQPHIDRANALVARVVTQAAVQRPGLVPTPTEQDLIRLSLACHFYCKADPLKSSKSTEGASASLVSGGESIKAQGERYKQEAIESDPSGMVNAFLNRQSAGATALGGPDPNVFDLSGD